MELDKNKLLIDLATLVMAFSPCLSRKRLSLEFDKHEMYMDWACACDGLFPLPVKEKAIMESVNHELFIDLATLAMAFPPCLSRKMPSLELDKHEIFMDLECVCDSLFPLPVEEKAIIESETNELLMVLHALTGLARSCGTRQKRAIFPDRHTENIIVEDLACACDSLFPLPVKEKANMCTCNGLSPLPVEEKAASCTWCALAMAFPPCLSRKRSSHGLGVRLRWAFPPTCRGKRRLVDLVCVCDGLFLLPVEEKGSMDPAETIKTGANM